MLIVHVHVHLKPEFVDAFRLATIENARNSVLEPGIARFDVHYAVWRDAVAEMMAEPRSAIKYDNVFPEDAGW